MCSNELEVSRILIRILLSRAGAEEEPALPQRPDPEPWIPTLLQHDSGRRCSVVTALAFYLYGFGGMRECLYELWNQRVY